MNVAFLSCPHHGGSYFFCPSMEGGCVIIVICCHSRDGGNLDVVPAKAGNQFHFSWIPDRASLVRNDVN
jgi:hypothetical protein